MRPMPLIEIIDSVLARARLMTWLENCDEGYVSEHEMASGCESDYCAHELVQLYHNQREHVVHDKRGDVMDVKTLLAVARCKGGWTAA